jgi:hypothetical protein
MKFVSLVIQLSVPISHSDKKFHDFTLMCLRYLKVMRPFYEEGIYAYECNLLTDNIF